MAARARAVMTPQPAARQAGAEQQQQQPRQEPMGRLSKSYVEASAARFPYCIVWSPIPVITWMIPFVGHMGVCASDGVIYDFAGPFHVAADSFTFGRATRFIQLDPRQARALGLSPSSSPEEAAELWDLHLQSSIRTYRELMYNFCTNNCHEFVAHFLNSLGYKASRDWNMVSLAALMLFQGRFVSLWAFIYSFAPFALLACPVLYFGRLYALTVWASVVGILTLWFIFYTYTCRLCCSGKRKRQQDMAVDSF